MAELVYSSYPNELTTHWTGNTGVRVLASDGTLYTTLALLAAASKVPWPGLDAGMRIGSWTIKAEDGSGADGAAIYFTTNKSTAPVDNDMMLCSGSGQAFNESAIPNNVWVRSVSANEGIISLKY